MTFILVLGGVREVTEDDETFIRNNKRVPIGAVLVQLSPSDTTESNKNKEKLKLNLSKGKYINWEEYRPKILEFILQSSEEIFNHWYGMVCLSFGFKDLMNASDRDVEESLVELNRWGIKVNSLEDPLDVEKEWGPYRLKLYEHVKNLSMPDFSLWYVNVLAIYANQSLYGKVQKEFLERYKQLEEWGYDQLTGMNGEEYWMAKPNLDFEEK